jgi:HAD superfamily hydrolase (TIGR01509 family)
MTIPRRAVVFDLDGTLVDSMPLVLQAYVHALEPYCPAMSADEIRRLLGGPPDRFFAQLIPERQNVADALLRLQAFAAAHWKMIVPFTGALALLADLRAASHSIGVWTGRERESTTWILHHNGIGEKLNACICGDDLSSHKPDPAGLAAVLRQLGVERAEAIFVGDAEVDLLAGSELGVRTILITYGRPTSDEISAKAWCLAETPTEAYALVRKELLGEHGGFSMNNTTIS